MSFSFEFVQPVVDNQNRYQQHYICGVTESILASTSIAQSIDPFGADGRTRRNINPMQIWISIGQWAWFAGITVLLIYSIISLLCLRSKLIGAVKWQDNIYLADHIESPFVMGLLRPKIYLPSTLSEQEHEYIILHEQTHIKRLDHIVKIVAFLVLTVHWFNPLVWMAFFCASRIWKCPVTA